MICLSDIEPPTITCPPNLDLIMAYWDDVNVTVQFDKDRPIVSDNSGHVTWRVLIGEIVGVDRVFRAGNWPIVYEAVDGSNNTATCTQIVHVRGKYLLLYCRL